MMKGRKPQTNYKHTEEWKQQHSKQMSGQNNPNYGKHTNGKKCLCIELNKVFESTRQEAKELDFNHMSIGRACRGEQKTAAGYHWKYVDE